MAGSAYIHLGRHAGNESSTVRIVDGPECARETRSRVVDGDGDLVADHAAQDADGAQKLLTQKCHV